MIGQRACRIENQLQAAEETAAQYLLRAQRSYKQLKTPGHVEIDRGRNVAQIAHSLREQRRHGTTSVDIEGATVAEDEIEIVISAKCVIPRQPVDDDRRRVFQEWPNLRPRLLIGAKHALRVDDPLGLTGRSRSEEQFSDRAVGDTRERACHLSIRTVADKAIEP